MYRRYKEKIRSELIIFITEFGENFLFCCPFTPIR